MRRLRRSPKGNEMRDSRVHLHLRTARIVALVATILVMAGCHDLASGALWGAGIGAVAGLALGGTSESTVVGAGIGALIGAETVAGHVEYRPYAYSYHHHPRRGHAYHRRAPDHRHSYGRSGCHYAY